ncbi:MAG: aspartyl protease family protein [Rhodobacteraceae bacterium]|nr:aspartyl protease family protein [Paracoccaceae bacterium]
MGVLLLASILAPSSVHAAVPIARAASGHATIPVTVASERADFVLDTGAEGTVLYRNFADRLGLTATSGSSQLVGQTGAIDLPEIEMPGFTVDGRTFGPMTTIALPSRADGVDLAGIVGLDVMKDALAVIDYPRGLFSLHDSTADPTVLAGKDAIAIDVRRAAGGLLVLDVGIGGVVGAAVLDSGSRDTRINWRFASALGIAPGSAALKQGGVIQGATITPVATVTTEVENISFAGHTVTKAEVRIADFPVFAQLEMSERPAMILGHDLLAGAKMVIDLAHDRVWFAWTE